MKADPIESVKSLVSEVEHLRNRVRVLEAEQVLYASWIRGMALRSGGRLTRTPEECEAMRKDQRGLFFGALEVTVECQPELIDTREADRETPWCKEAPPFPDYATVGTSALEHTGKGEYHRPAGGWSVPTEWKQSEEGVWRHVVKSHRGPTSHMAGYDLNECSEDHFREDNHPYVS